MKQAVIRLGQQATIPLAPTTIERLAAVPEISVPGLTLQSSIAPQRDGDNLLLVLGTPLPAIEIIPANWQAAMQQLPQREGVFAALFWDAQAQKLVICTDVLGLQPLYWQRRPGEVVLSDKTTTFVGSADLAGWGAFLALGYPLGADTLTSEVKRLDPATVWVLEQNGEISQQQRYWQFDSEAPAASIDEVASALGQSVDLAIAAVPDTEHGILLSGGYDSRLIAFLLHQRQVSMRATIVSHYDENLDADARFAKAIARHLQIPFRLQLPEQDFFSSPAYLDYLAASDGEIPSLYLFISQVGQFIDAPVVWEGLLPGKTLKASEASFAAFWAANVKDFKQPQWRAAELVFGAEQAAAMWQAFTERWQQEQAVFPDSGEGTARFNLAHRARNRVGPNPFKVYQQKATVLMPGMSRAYLQAAMSVPHSSKQQHQFYQQLFARHYPDALRFPIAHGSVVSPMHSRSLVDYGFLAALACHNRLSRYPRWMKRLGLKPAAGFSRSRFLDPSRLAGQGALDLNPALMASIENGSELPEQAIRLLFYWRCWQGLRHKNLRDLWPD
ncbi:asparagine synthase-related protein [Alkalimonas delamerensis]|uniref:asparagine synthase (glutamine-hydrolyzing) n=1 Tax=Alkalimonas delamerensis TaxID=265981 RepID=A0ABT9GMG9_9GAMM|nr:asparagine synthase-related protein [Alkalimonas delamerensis]MDP4528129.1 asparagine synthase-related protein [Alkalimonas delamerensis]